MPFVTEEHRRNPDVSIPGDRCYLAYKNMMLAWNKEPRWATIDAIHANLGGLAMSLWETHTGADLVEWETAVSLAWQVFFGFHGMTYEREKRAINGDVTGEI